MTRQQIIQEAASLSQEDRIALAMDLWDLADGPTSESALTDVHRRELDRRIDADVVDTSALERWDQLREKLLRRDV